MADYAIYDPTDESTTQLVGKVITRGLSDELHDKHFLIVDGTDGRSHYVAIGQAYHGELIPEGAIVEISPNRRGVSTVDRTIADIASSNQGHYSAALHRQAGPSAGEEFIASHIRRLEALRRSGNIVERSAGGIWTISSDHLERVATFEKQRTFATPVHIEKLSIRPLSRQIEIEGATLLDAELTSAKPLSLREAGFGKELSDAIALRRQWLLSQELARVVGDRTIYRTDLVQELRRRELLRVGAQVSAQLGLPFAETRHGDSIEGIYRRKVELVSGSFALIQRSREFTLVPWRPVLERAIDQQVSGQWRGHTISWTFGRTPGRSVG